MSKSIVKQFTDFKKRHSLSTQEIIKMMTEYANSDLDLASSYFSEKFNISKSTFYKARDYAIICCLIDEELYKRIKRKTIENYRRKNPNGTTTGPVEHFSELYIKRQEFLKTFSDNDLKDIACKYADGVSTENIAFAYDTGKYAIKMLLKKGITQLIVDDDITKAISLRLGSKFDNIFDIRQQNKQKVVNCVKKQIEALNLQIECYDLYYRTEKEKPEKEELQNQLKNLMKKEQEFLR